MSLVSTAAAVAMAVGAPLVYADQAWSMKRKRNSEGFSRDVCAVLLIANITRCFFWFGERFEAALLLQSILMIAAQLYLLHLIILYRPGSYASAAFTASSGDLERARVEQVLFDSAHPGAAARKPQFKIVVDPPSAPSATASAPPAPLQRLPSDGDVGLSQAIPATESSRGGRGGYSVLADSEADAPRASAQHDADEDAYESGGLLGRVRAGWSSALRSVGGPEGDDENGLLRFKNGRPFGFWTWERYQSYLVFLFLYCVMLTVLYLALGGFKTFVSLLGFFALGLESALPVPQLISNHQRQSLSGFRFSVLVGWLLGDSFKTLYFILNKSPLQFTVCALFQLSIDLMICAQAYFYRERTRSDDEERERLDEERQREQGNAQQDWVEPVPTTAHPPQHSQAGLPDLQSSNVWSGGDIEPDEDDEDTPAFGKGRR